MFSKKNLKQIQSKGIEIETINQQINNFKKGFPYANLVKPATPGDGILTFSKDTIEKIIKFYEHNSKNIRVIKFVPASGAASRMFKTLFSSLENNNDYDEKLKKFYSDKSFNSVYNFINKIKDFAFYNDLKAVLLDAGINIEEKLANKEYDVIFDYVLNEKGLDYGKLPKGLLLFHRYINNNRMAFEEHLVEAAEYGTVENGKAAIHFTVSPEHLKKFRDQIDIVAEKYEKQYDVSYDISFSVQKPSTDTIAVDMNNEPFREADNSLLFRPGGHGALIENLNDLEGDIIFIKNIDNIVPDRLKSETTVYKKVIGGLLLKLQQQIFEYLKLLDKNTPEDTKLKEIAEFAQSELNINLPSDFNNLKSSEKIKFLFEHLNRPIRICGMVKNEGEPGGGPFWVKNSKGEVSLQIVESSQIDQDNTEQKTILQSATHFNPVDLVCGLKNYKGELFDLHQFIDYETGFISIKSKEGKNLKAQELPGLWNGAMANWITIFVEVPVITFNPVKTVNDLLREQHQP